MRVLSTTSRCCSGIMSRVYRGGNRGFCSPKMSSVYAVGRWKLWRSRILRMRVLVIWVKAAQQVDKMKSCCVVNVCSAKTGFAGRLLVTGRLPRRGGLLSPLSCTLESLVARLEELERRSKSSDEFVNVGLNGFWTKDGLVAMICWVAAPPSIRVYRNISGYIFPPFLL